MGIVVAFKAHGRASASRSVRSKGYKSGRRSCRETPEIRSTDNTRSGGTSSHCETACIEMPSEVASLAKPPTASMARNSASFRSLIVPDSIISLVASQLSLHCGTKEVLYAIDMSLGKRIQAARKRLHPKLTQREIAEKFGITYQAVSQWERDEGSPELEKLPALARLLKVPVTWLLEGKGAPPSPDDVAVLLETFSEDDRQTIAAMVKALASRRGRAA